MQQKPFHVHLTRNTTENNISKVYQNRSFGTMPNLHKFKMAAVETAFVYISRSKTGRHIILVSIPMFSGSRKLILSTFTSLDHLLVPNLHKFKMAAIFKQYWTITPDLRQVEVSYWCLCLYFVSQGTSFKQYLHHWTVLSYLICINSK